jgi:23S rRNA pseudouridine2457 synthase
MGWLPHSDRRSVNWAGIFISAAKLPTGDAPRKAKPGAPIARLDAAQLILRWPPARGLFRIVNAWTVVTLPINEFALPMLIAFHKPFGVLSQFTPDGSPNRALAGFNFPKGVYPIGRLDADSEGLLLLSDEAALNARLLQPRHAHEREYWAQVERVPTAEALANLARGVAIQGRATLPCRAWMLDPQPAIPPRDPPIRFRKTVPTCWISLELVEGKNRQVRRMTAAVGHPTLRLIRVRIGGLKLGELAAGSWRILDPAERALALRSGR